MAFAGLTADARVLIKQARVECQSHKLTVEDPVTLEYITRHVASLKQRYTQSNGRRPFGISCLITGFDYDKTPRLYQTDPSGTYHEWKANAIGRNSKTVREFLEKSYAPDKVDTEEATVKLAIKALLEVVQSGGKNLEICVMSEGQKMRMMALPEIEKVVAEVEKEKEEEAGMHSKRVPTHRRVMGKRICFARKDHLIVFHGFSRSELDFVPGPEFLRPLVAKSSSDRLKP
jgi:20S proteasome subunit alpha 4